MKKFSLLAVLLIATALMVSCTATKAEATEAAIIEPIETAATVVEPQAAAVTEPIETAAVVEESAEPETVVIDSAPAISPEAEDLDQKFSYVYGHLLAGNILGQGIHFTPSYFIQGSGDFYNFLDPVISVDEINDAFNSYQGYLDGVVSDEELAAGSDEDSEIPVSLLARFSYGYGYVIQFNLQSQGIIVSLEDYHNGVSDAVAGIPLPYTDEEIDALFIAYQEKLMAEYLAMAEQFGAENLARAESFLAENGQLEDVVTTQSGLQYKVITEGDGAKPTETDTVEVDYMITFLDGSTGDNSYSRGEPSIFAMSDLIPGFVEGMELMPVGSHYRFYLHPSLAYGETGNETIPPNTLLIFDVELHSIVGEEE